MYFAYVFGNSVIYMLSMGTPAQMLINEHTWALWSRPIYWIFMLICILGDFTTMKLVFLKFRDSLLVIQWLKTDLTAEFITNSNSLGFSPLKKIFLSSAMVPHGS